MQFYLSSDEFVIDQTDHCGLFLLCQNFASSKSSSKNPGSVSVWYIENQYPEAAKTFNKYLDIMNEFSPTYCNPNAITK